MGHCEVAVLSSSGLSFFWCNLKHINPIARAEVLCRDSLPAAAENVCILRSHPGGCLLTSSWSYCACRDVCFFAERDGIPLNALLRRMAEERQHCSYCGAEHPWLV